MKNFFQWSIFRLGPVTAAFEGREYVIYHYSRYLETHMNDFSVRFRTKQSNAILFQTYSTQGHNDFIRAELENGRIKVTVRVNGRDQVNSSRSFISTTKKKRALTLRALAFRMEIFIALAFHLFCNIYTLYQRFAVCVCTITYLWRVLNVNVQFCCFSSLRSFFSS